MKYATINVIGSDVYARELEKLVENGYRVISAGASHDTRVDCFRWWAIAEKNDEPQRATETRPVEAAELLEAARVIKRACEERLTCDDCIFGKAYSLCSVSRPESWEI